MLLPVQAHLARPLFVGASAALEPVLTREFAQASFVRGDKASRGEGSRVQRDHKRITVRVTIWVVARETNQLGGFRVGVGGCWG